MIFLYGQGDAFPNYRQAIEAAGGQLRCSVRMDDAETCSGLLLPGGGDIAPWRYGAQNAGSLPPDPEQDWAELTLTERFASANKPILGICRGLQIINVFFGGTLLQDIPGHRSMDGIDRFHRVWTEPRFRCLLPERIVNSSHHQAVLSIGAGLRGIQWAPDGTVEALVHSSLPILAVQWHPERMNSPGVFQWFLKKCQER